MEIVIYFVGFFIGGLTLILVAMLDLPFWAAILFCAGCAAIGLLVTVATVALGSEEEQ